MDSNVCKQVKHWLSCMDPTMSILQKLAENTEEQFLELGSRLQDFSLRSVRISDLAAELVQMLSGEESAELTGSLHTLFIRMNEYLQQVDRQGDESCETLEKIMKQLDEVVKPLEGFQKMDKALRMLSISTKIESARLGELGSGFTTLAMDVEKLSQTVSEKSEGIMGQRHNLSQLISSNLQMVRSTEARQFNDARQILSTVEHNLEAITELNNSSTATGHEVVHLSEEISSDMAAIVSSMQFHDITRQQIEHVIEALDKIQQHSCGGEPSEEACTSFVSEIGDVCELQSAQAKHAADQLGMATNTILDSLRDIAARQTRISEELQRAMIGSADSGNTSLLDQMGDEMQQVILILQKCDKSDRELAAAMQQITGTITEIGSFVSDIEAVGSEIDLIALNAQIKAAHTGPQGAALGVLAEAIKRLSLDAVVQTEAVTSTLHNINKITEGMASLEVMEDLEGSEEVADLEQQARQIIASLAETNRTVQRSLNTLANTANDLSDDINLTTAGIHVHDDVKEQMELAVSALEQIYMEAREKVPASTEFRNNLQHMEQRYTMESERLIHEMMASRHGVKLNLHRRQESSVSDSEFGDNVDLF